MVILSFKTEIYLKDEIKKKIIIYVYMNMMVTNENFGGIHKNFILFRNNKEEPGL